MANDYYEQISEWWAVCPLTRRAFTRRVILKEWRNQQLAQESLELDITIRNEQRVIGSLT